MRVTRSAQARSDRFSVASLLTNASPLPKPSAIFAGGFFLDSHTQRHSPRLRVTRSAQSRSDRFSVASLLTNASPLPKPSAIFAGGFFLDSHTQRHSPRSEGFFQIIVKPQPHMHRFGCAGSMYRPIWGSPVHRRTLPDQTRHSNSPLQITDIIPQGKGKINFTTCYATYYEKNQCNMP